MEAMSAPTLQVDMGLGFAIGLMGVMILGHAAYSTVQYRGLLKILEDDISGPPLSVPFSPVFNLF